MRRSHDGHRRGGRIVEAPDRAAENGIRQKLAEGIAGAAAERAVVDQLDRRRSSIVTLSMCRPTGHDAVDRIAGCRIALWRRVVGNVGAENEIVPLQIVAEEQTEGLALVSLFGKRRPARRRELIFERAIAQEKGDLRTGAVAEIGVHARNKPIWPPNTTPSQRTGPPLIEPRSQRCRRAGRPPPPRAAKASTRQARAPSAGRIAAAALSRRVQSSKLQRRPIRTSCAASS